MRWYAMRFSRILYLRMILFLPEPIRNVKFKILDATIASEAIHRGGGQVKDDSCLFASLNFQF